jgi:uncharacterized protein
MDYLVICIIALLASALTLFSGFGLGTLLLPAFAIFFPIELAIAMTAIVHLANNLFKFLLLGRHADWSIVLRFGIPAIAASVLGAWILIVLSDIRPVYTYEISGRTFAVTPVKLAIGVLMAAFALLDLSGRLERTAIPRKYLPVGGLLSGFFGGLSGHQGPLRSAFLIKAGLSKEAYIATGIVIACMVDIGRLAVYASDMRNEEIGRNWTLIAAATGAAFLGAVIGARFIRKVTIRQIQFLVAIMLLQVSIALMAGII